MYFVHRLGLRGRIKKKKQRKRLIKNRAKIKHHTQGSMIQPISCYMRLKSDRPKAHPICHFWKILLQRVLGRKICLVSHYLCGYLWLCVGLWTPNVNTKKESSVYTHRFNLIRTGMAEQRRTDYIHLSRLIPKNMQNRKTIQISKTRGLNSLFMQSIRQVNQEN
jgi:hypothetical protein